MRSILVLAAVLALAALGVGKAVLGWPALPQGAEASVPVPVRSTPPPRPSAHMELVNRAQFLQAQRRPAQGALVLDLERLESIEAAQTLARSWSEARPGGAPLVCWLAAADRAEASAAAAVLAREGCTELRVAG